MADHLSVSRPTVTAVVDGLVARGLVDRRHDEQDRRRVGHSITSEGRKLLERADVTLEAALDEILGHAEDESDRHSAIDGLISWQRALDRYRSARHAEKSQRAASPSEAVMS
jgi:long-chain acyl-CoA synthetase